MKEMVPSEQFIRNVTEIQRDLYAYILTLLPKYNDAEDVLQETNVVLWSKREDFQAHTNFRAWVYRIAHFEVLAYRTRQGRERHRFDDHLVEQMSGELQQRSGSHDDQRQALAQCTEKLDHQEKELLKMRYGQSLLAPQIAPRVGRSVLAIRQALYRIRITLKKCVERTLSSERRRV